MPDCVEIEVRKTLLKWISRAIRNKYVQTNENGRYGQTKTEDGRTVVIKFPNDNRMCELKCEDGILKMPAFTLEIE